MIVIAVDDERFALQALTDAALAAGIPADRLHAFSTCRDTLAFVEENRFDLALLDIDMRGMGGLKLAEELRKKNPDCRVIFCTGHPDYALDAFGLHADGYLLKPVTPEMLRREIERFLPRAGKKKLRVECFGAFTVTDADGQPLPFKRSKSRELLALLIDRRGGMSSKEICAYLFEDDGCGDEKNLAYLWNLMSDLKKALQAAGAEDALLHPGNLYGIDRAAVDCDFYRYLDGDKTLFKGEYMSRYSWAEETLALLLSHQI